MKKLIFSVVTLCVSFLSLAQDNSHSLSDTYFRMKKNEISYPLGFHFYRDGTVLIRIFEEGSLVWSGKSIQGRYFDLKDGRVQLAPSRRKGLFDVSYRNNPDIEKGKVRLTFDLSADADYVCYALTGDTLTNETLLVEMDKLRETEKSPLEQYVFTEDYREKLILIKENGYEQIVMTYEIPKDMNDLYIESFGLNEEARLYLLHIIHQDNSNLLKMDYNVKGIYREKPSAAYYIRPLNDTDQAYLHAVIDFPLPGYTYLNPSDIYLQQKKSGGETNPEDDTSDSGEDVTREKDIDEQEDVYETGGISSQEKKNLDLLLYNETVLKPLIKAGGKDLKKSAETYFTNLFKVMNDDNDGRSSSWYSFINRYNYDTLQVLPDYNELTGLLDIYAEGELKRTKPDTTAAGLICMYYNTIYYCYESITPSLSPSVRYLLKNTAAINDRGKNREDFKGVWKMIESILECVDYPDDDATEALFKEIMQTAPEYRDFVIMEYNHMHNRWNYKLFAEYIESFKGWDMNQFRAHDDSLKKMEASYYELNMSRNSHPVAFCGEFSWLLNRVASDIYKDSWKGKSDYLDDAVGWARLATELCIQELLSEYMNTYACLLYQTGNRDEAVRIAEIAVRSLTEEQKNGFMGQKVRVDYELIKRGRLTSEQAWLE